jgi:hypothetical protein
MTQKATTKDELFLLKLYELAVKKGDPTEAIDRYIIGKAIGQNDHGIDTIGRHLAQANFVKKVDETHLYLTQNGINLVMHIKKERPN